MRSVINDFLDTKIQKKVFKTVHGGKQVNSFEPWHESKRTVCSNGQLYVNDLCYGMEYPNSFFDIRYPNEDTAEKRPTVIYFHGGGFLFGDKSDGDPLAVGENGVSAMLSEISSRGYNVVSANYAFATKYRCPVQIRQVDQLMAHLLAHSEYGLDMDRVVLMGGSAGANLTAIYGLLVADEAYAKRMGITPCLTAQQLKALAIDEMVLNYKHYSKGLTILGTAWSGERKPGHMTKLVNVAEQFSGKFLPSFLTASNIEPPFEKCASEMAEKLKENNIPYELYYKAQEESEPLAHGFMATFGTNRYAKECFEQMMKFVEKWV